MARNRGDDYLAGGASTYPPECVAGSPHGSPVVRVASFRSLRGPSGAGAVTAADRPHSRNTLPTSRMSSSITKLQRWLDLIAFLVSRRLPVAVDDIMEAIPAYAVRWADGTATERDSVRRTFERDKEELRRAGIPIESVEYQVNFGAVKVEGYTLKRRDFYLPYLRLVAGGVDEASAAGRPYHLPDVQLTEDEADLAFEALREVESLPSFPFAREARSAMRKLAFDLDLDASDGGPILYVPSPAAGEVRERIRPLTDALLARKRVRFVYHGIHRGEETTREVRPYGLFFQRGSWYLVGFDVGRAGIRVFRVDRMERVEPNTRALNTPDYTIPDDFRLDAYLQREAWELGDEEPLRVHVLFHFPRSLWAERNRHGTLMEGRADGAAVREFAVQQTNPFLRWLLSLGAHAEILSPPDLAMELEEMARKIASKYQEVS